MTIIITFLLIVISILLYLYEREISVALINALLWTALSTLVIIFQLPTNGRAYIFVFLSVLSFTGSYVMVRRISRKGISVNYNNETLSYNEELYKRIVIIVSLANIISVLSMAHNLGFRLSTFTSMRSLMIRMNTISGLRYSGEGENLPFVSRIINSIVYASMSYSGYYFSKDKRKIHLVNLFIILLETVVLNTKATMVFGIAFWLGGYFTGLMKMKKKPRLKSIIILLVSLFAALLIAAGVNYLRHTGVRTYYTELQSMVFSYFIGPFSAFSLWFPSYDGSLDLGANSFACVFRWLGIKSQTHGNSIEVNSIVGTNVYTAFKHLLNDFSYIGTIVVMCFLGFIGGVSMQNIQKRNNFAVSWCMVFSATILVSFFSSMFRYTTNLFACVIILTVPLVHHFTIGGKRII